MANGPIKNLLVKSSSPERYWATVEEYSYERQSNYPSYYEDVIDNMSTWLKITKIEEAEDGVIDKCITSTGKGYLTFIKNQWVHIFVLKLNSLKYAFN